MKITRIRFAPAAVSSSSQSRLEDTTSEQPSEEGTEFNIIIQPEQLAGVWANFAKVSHSQYEFTLDFVRLDFASKQGIVVARVSVSPLFITQLIDALTENWEGYAEKAMPKEVRDEPGQGEGPDGQGT